MKSIKNLIKAVHQGRTLKIDNRGSNIKQRAEAKQWLKKFETHSIDRLSDKILILLNQPCKDNSSIKNVYFYMKALENNDIEHAQKFYKLCLSNKTFSKEKKDFLKTFKQKYNSRLFKKLKKNKKISSPAIKTTTFYTPISRQFDEDETRDLTSAYIQAAEDYLRSSGKFHGDIFKWNKKTQKIQIRLARWLLWRDVHFDLIKLEYKEVLNSQKDFIEILKKDNK